MKHSYGLGALRQRTCRQKSFREKGDVLRIKAEEGSEEERKVVLTAIVPNEDPACLAYCVEEDENVPDCISISSEDTNGGIQKPEVQAILKELAGIKIKEADCYEQLVAAITRMTDEEVKEVGEKVWPSKLLRCIDRL